jgi:tetratricopeptide (TPR) repeat protein
MITRIIEKCRTELERNPNNATAHHDLAAAYLAKGDLSGAIKHLKRTVELAPRHAESHFLLGVAYGDSGRIDDAISAWKKALELDARSGASHYFLGRAYAGKGMWDAALMHLQKANRLKPKGMNANLIDDALAEVCLALGKLDEARSAWERAANIKADGRIFANLAAVCLDLRDYDGALGYVQEAKEIGFDSLRLSYNEGVAYLKKGQLPEARLVLEKAWGRKDRDVDVGLALVETIAAEGDKAGALVRLGEVTAAYPDNPDVAFRQGVLLSEQGQTEEASKLWAKAIKINSAYTPAYGALANLAHKEGRHQDERELWANFARINPDSVFGRLSLAQSELELGYIDAVKSINTLGEKAVPDPDLLVVQGLAYWLDNDPERAVILWQEAARTDRQALGRQAALVQREAKDVEALKAALEGKNLADLLNQGSAATGREVAAQPNKKSSRAIWPWRRR